MSLSCPLQIVFVENISQLDTLCQEHGFDKNSVHRLTDRSV